MPGSEDDHVARAAKSWLVPSVIVPVALNCSVSPTYTAGACGDSVSVTSSAGVIVSVALALPPFRLAVMVACPTSFDATGKSANSAQQRALMLQVHDLGSDRRLERAERRVRDRPPRGPLQVERRDAQLRRGPRLDRLEREHEQLRVVGRGRRGAIRHADVDRPLAVDAVAEVRAVGAEIASGTH